MPELPLVVTCQRAAVPIGLASWRKMATSSPYPSPQEEERETAPRPVSTQMRVKSSGGARTPVVLAACTLAGEYRI
jgi:hypothetical protein